MSQDYSAGQRLGDYEVLGVLGAGGMGKVYKVRNVISERVEAMKILLPNLSGQKDLADRFLREIKLLASLHHPNIAALRTAQTLDDQLVMIMEYVEGVTLSSRLRLSAIPPADSIHYIDQVLSALSYAHHLNIVHRDIKPGNMMLMSDGVVKLMDFGIARSGGDRSLTGTGTTLGSLNYMPPEQVKGEPADARSDIYSLGVSMYEMVTGLLPFDSGSNYSIMAAHLEQAPKPPIVHQPGLPETLNQIILMAMAKDPGRRFQSADAFRAALKSVDVEAIKTPPSSTTMPPSWTPPYASSGSDTTIAGNISKPVPAAVAAPVAARAPQVAAAVATQPGSPVPVSSGHRGLYMGLGAMVAVGVLFAAGFYLPRRQKIHAGESQSAFPSTKNPGTSPQGGRTPADQGSTAGSENSGKTGSPAVIPKAPPSGGDVIPEAVVPAPPPPKVPQLPDAVPAPAKSSQPPNAKELSNSNSALRKSDASHGARAAADQAAGDTARKQEADAVKSKMEEKTANAAELAEAEHQDEQLSSRAASVSESLQGLKSQQSAQGFGLRGDVSSAEQRMNTYLSKGQAALQSQDAANARKYLGMAEREVTFLEKFLGH